MLKNPSIPASLALIDPQVLRFLCLFAAIMNFGSITDLAIWRTAGRFRRRFFHPRN